MRARVVVSLLVLCVVAVAQAEAATTTPSPTPSFVSKGTESPTPRPKLTTPTPDYQATIDALKTQIAAKEPTPKPTATRTPTPRPTATPTLTAYEKYPPNVAEVAATDSAHLCDTVGWNVDDWGEYDKDSRHFSACNATASVAMACFKVTRAGTSALPDPFSGHEWVFCSASVLNNGVDSFPLGPSNFHVVDADNLRYGTVSDSYFETYLPSGVLHDDNLPPHQDTVGLILFDVLTTIREPIRVEVNLSAAIGEPPLVIVVEWLKEYSDVFPQGV
jgi:hypothetical protein